MKTKERLSEISHTTGKDLLVTFNEFLDACIYNLNFPRPTDDRYEIYEEAIKDIAVEYYEGITKDWWVDPLGDMFMDITKGLQKYRGQFFTPPSICKLMAEITESCAHSEEKTYCGAFGNRIVVSDPACGSGRNLLAISKGFAGKPTNESPYYIGEDLDSNCCKMTAINLCLHGVPGEVICHNTLSEPGSLKFGYVINETTYPFFTGVPSIRRFEDKSRFVLFRKTSKKVSK